MQNRTVVACLVVAVLAVLTLGTEVSAQAPASTVITVEKMHCGGCAKKIATKLQQVSGVADVQFNVQAKTLVVVAQPKMAPSPRAMWEAVESANDRPIKLQGPSGTFTSKPQS